MRPVSTYKYAELCSSYLFDTDILTLCENVSQLTDFDIYSISALVGHRDMSKSIKKIIVFAELLLLSKRERLLNVEFEGKFKGTDIVVMCDFDSKSIKMYADDVKVIELFKGVLR